jgi:hypothetical protein
MKRTFQIMSLCLLCMTSVAFADEASCTDKVLKYVRAVVAVENIVNYSNTDFISQVSPDLYSVTIEANGNYPNFFTYDVSVKKIYDSCTVLNMKYVDVDGEGPNGN